METSSPRWAVTLFGTDADRIREAAATSLAETEDAMLSAHAVGRSKHQFAASGARMTNQFERLLDNIMELDIPGTRVVEHLAVFYKLVLVHDVLLFPYRADTKERVEPSDKWPKKVSKIVRELFAFAPERRWETPSLFETGADNKVELRATLASLPESTQLVLVPYVMNLSGLRAAWWGQAALAGKGSLLQWVHKPESLLSQNQTRATGVPPYSAHSFDAGDMPEAKMTVRSDAERKFNVPPVTEQEASHSDVIENNEG
ncbi:hypothetical protein [Sphaerisporangium corydalis]|uniref:Uncharacterized protein n=1 Tax=Sphaerisporangium corydalis TaxID=1441875 RepID=A0ABV9EK44_9ACTN|nr:hypothetical protein [Sphaerisporangium corydalis]